MDRYSKLATLALLGSASATATVRNIATNPLQFDGIASKAGATANADEAIDTSSPLTWSHTITPYQCVRRAGHYFFPQKYDAGVPVTGARSFYLHDNAQDQASLSLSTIKGGTHVSALGTTGTAGTAGYSGTNFYQANTWETEYIMKFSKDGTSNNFNGVKTKNYLGRSDCCPLIDETDNAKCAHQLYAQNWLTTAVQVSGFIPEYRLWYRAPEALQGIVASMKQTCIYMAPVSATQNGTTASVTCGQKGSGTNSALVIGQIKDADATQADNTVTVPVWNNDFLLASLYQQGTGTNTSNFCSDAGSTPNAKQVYGIDNSITAGKALQMKHGSYSEKCTWFLAANNTTTNNFSSSFQVTAANKAKYQLHWVEWQKGNIASGALLGATEDTSVRWGNMPGTVQETTTASNTFAMEWPNPLKKVWQRGMASTSNLTPIGTATAPWYTDDFLNPTWGPTKGYLGFLSGTISGPSEKAFSLVDFNQYNLFRLDYNKQVAAYNTAAKTYSDAAKKYTDDVAARKKQLADPMNASFATPVAIPKVPCLNFNKPAAWAGATPYVPASVQNLDATSVTQADRVNKFVYTYPTSGSDWNTPKMQVTKSQNSDASYSYKSGYLRFQQDDSFSVPQIGVNHVFGLLGQGTTDAAAATTTFTTGLKAHRWAAYSTDVPNYMMVSLFPYSKTTSDYTSADLTITAFKNDFSTDALTFAFDTATAPANEVKEADQFTGAKALIATATAFAAVAMTLQ